jgi:aminoglycoside 2'-N-acetyltransferase I
LSDPGDAGRFRTAHTADVGTRGLVAIRAMLEAAFAERPDGPFGDDDWTHSLGGMHVWVSDRDGDPDGDGGDVVAHACVVARRMLHDGRVLRCGYVEAVAVRDDHRRRGLGGIVMTEIERLIGSAYDLGALGATEVGAPLYRSHGWQPWAGTLSALTPDGIRPTPEELGTVHVLTVDGVALDLTGEFTCDWREGDVW